MSDALLEVAITNWAARFTANGVDPSDYARLTGSVETWSDWCPTWSTGAEIHLALGRAALTAGHLRSAGESLARAATYFHFAQFLLDAYPVERAVAHASAVSALMEAGALLDPPIRRVTVPFEDETLSAVLRLPPGEGPHPVIVLIAGLDSTKEEFREVERSFLERGLGTFAVDGPGQGEGGHLAIRPDWEVVGAAILTALRAQDGVDAARIGVWGVSLGAYYAARLASADLGVTAVVALSGPYDFADAWAGLNPLTRAAFVARSHSANEAEAEEAARALSLAGRAGSISAPLLVVVGQLDRLISWRDGARLADEAPLGELLLLAEGTHGCANVIYRHRPLAADWLADHLGAAAPRSGSEVQRG